ncbi:YitT family protein [Alkalihalobacterium bogoriense]|uniref:YitT family protein n=1 Tax=Alkalihalobacterium bogoriense TaxID=246272 RepID=UPI001FE17862|nr:YitT family protein [Alkalihalobacterium bogoriense]
MATAFKKIILITIGLFLTALGLRLLAVFDFTFGGTAGIASILTFSSELPWGIWFFLVNLPFFIISLRKLGKWFSVYSLLSITGISMISEVLTVITYVPLPSWLTTIIAALSIGFGVTLVLNNGSSLGGIHILALYLDQRWKINRGISIFVSDLLIILCAGLLVGWSNAVLSVAAIMIASTIIGRYKKTPIKQAVEDEVEEGTYAQSS